MDRTSPYQRSSTSLQSLAARLIRDVGFNPVDMSSLSTARFLEPFSLPVAQLAYDGSDGPELVYRCERFQNRTG